MMGMPARTPHCQCKVDLFEVKNQFHDQSIDRKASLDLETEAHNDQFIEISIQVPDD